MGGEVMGYLHKVCVMLVALSMVGGCGLIGGFGRGGKPPIMATGGEEGKDGTFWALKDGEAAIAYDPDGCQVWVIDDGPEGYASPRFDPVSGLPVCNDIYPPGSVIDDPHTKERGSLIELMPKSSKGAVIKSK